MVTIVCENVKDVKEVNVTQDIVWHNVRYIAIWHIASIYTAVWILPTATLTEILVLWIGLYYISALGITAGCHRLWSHRSYKATTPLKVFLMLANAMAFQGSIFEWSRDHRVHHKGSETDADPHNAKRGFWFSHIGWTIMRKHPQVISQGRQLDLSDLLRDKIVMFQKKYYFMLAVLMCYVTPAVIGYCINGSALNGLLIGGFFRHVWLLHMTWFVNSAAHLWGSRPYAPDINPAENLFVSIGALGEGWHNYQ
jgi:stearoyl-CoA desaturase (delta-9 desaturase)